MESLLQGDDRLRRHLAAAFRASECLTVLVERHGPFFQVLEPLEDLVEQIVKMPGLAFRQEVHRYLLMVLYAFRFPQGQLGWERLTVRRQEEHV